MTTTNSDDAAASISSSASSSTGPDVRSTGGTPRRISAVGGLIALTPEIVVGVLALVVFGWSVGGADPWRDELATLEVASWPIGAIMKLADHVELAHAAYYLLVHPLLTVDQSIVAVRLVSVVAMAAAAVVLVRVGRALDGWPVGLGAGLMLIVSAGASRYAQEARSYALVVLLVTLTALSLIRAIESRVDNRRWAIYSALLVATGLVHILGTLIVLAHGVWVSRAPAARRNGVILRWCVSTGLAGAVLAPLAVLLHGQVTAEVGYNTRPPGRTELTDLQALAWPPPWEIGVLTLITVVVVGVWGTSAARNALVLGLAWGLIPPLALWVVSQGHPLYAPRYVLYSVPGVALALGSLAGLRFARRSPPAPGGDAEPGVMAATEGNSPRQTGRAAAAVAVVLVPAVALALGGLPRQRSQRLPNGHGDNFGRIAQILATESRNGDGIVFLPHFYRVMKIGFPLPSGVDDITLDRDGPSTAEINGWPVTPQQAVERLSRHCRVWLITQSGALAGGWAAYAAIVKEEGGEDTDAAMVRELSAGYRQVESIGGIDDVLLFASRNASCSA
jgi:mannosyltransferase